MKVDVLANSLRLARVAIVSAALALAWLAVRNAALGVLTEPAPDYAAYFWPLSPHVELNRVLRGKLSMTVPVSAEARTRLADVARNAPLLAEPFYAASMTSQARGRLSEAIARMEQATRRDPRLVQGHLLLIEQYAKAGRLAEATSEIAIALRLPLPDGVAERLMAALYQMSTDPRASAALARIFATNPAWRPSFVDYVSSRGDNPELLFKTLNESAARATAPGSSSEQTSFLEGLLAKKDYDRAYLAWVNFLPASVVDRATLVYDPDFRKLPGPAPFNWTLLSNEGASAEMTDGSRVPPGTALSVNFFGSGITHIAVQTLLAPPGNYQLSITAAGNSESALGGIFAWQVACLPGGTPIARLEFAGLKDRPITRRIAVTIPTTECGAQSLTLLGIPGETSAQTSGEFGAIRLTRQ